MRRKLVTAAFILLLLITLLSLPTPLSNEESQNPQTNKAGQTTSGLGASVDLTYTFPALYCFEGAMYDGTIGLGSSYYSTLDKLPESYFFGYYDASGPYSPFYVDMILRFQGLTGAGTYTSSNSLAILHTQTTFNYWIYTYMLDWTDQTWDLMDTFSGSDSGAGGTYTDAPSFSFSSNYIDADGNLCVRVQGKGQSTSAGTIRRCDLTVEFPRTTRSQMTETRRTSYEVAGGTVLYTLEFMAPECITEVNISHPESWDYFDINPSATVTEETGKISIDDTDQDTIYSVSFVNDVIATANWELVHSESFEAGIPYGKDDWQFFMDTANGPASAELEYTIVADGSVSMNLTNDAIAEGKMNMVFPASVITSPIFITAQLYVVSGSAKMSYKYGSWVSQVSSTTGKWETLSVYLPNLDSTTFVLNTITASQIAYWDAIQIYQSSVDTGETITGTCRYIHPNGYSAASYVEVELGLWDGTSVEAWQEYQDVMTDANGEWSFDTDDFSTSLTAQTYNLWTWVYTESNTHWGMDAATESIADWATTLGVHDTEQLSTDAHEGMYSCEGYDNFDTTDQLRFTYNIVDQDIGEEGLLLYFWWKLNDTTALATGTRMCVRDQDGTVIAIQNLINRFDFAINTWTKVVIPLFSEDDSYECDLWGGDVVFDYSLWGMNFLSLFNSSNTDVGYSFKVDSMNFINSYTHDSLTCYQLGMTSVTFEKLNDYESYFTVTGETYSQQLYTVTLDGDAIVTDIEPDCVVERNSSVGTHTYSVTATSRDDDAAHLDSTAKTYSYTQANSTWIIYSWDIKYGDVYGWLTIESSRDASYVIYENDSSVASGSIDTPSDNVRWTLGTTIGEYYVGVLLTNGTETKWLNDSYTVSAGQTVFVMVFRDADDWPLPWNLFDVYVDGIPCLENFITVNASDTVNVTAVDKWGQIVYQDLAFVTGSGLQTKLDESLIVYEVFLDNQKLFGCYCTVTRQGTGVTKNYPGDFTIHLYNDTYTFQWYETDSGRPVGDAQVVDITAFATIYSPRQPIDPKLPGGPSDDYLRNLTLQNISIAAFNMNVLVVVTFLVAGLVIIIILFISWISGQLTDLRPQWRYPTR